MPFLKQKTIMNKIFIEFNLTGCQRKVSVNVSKIMDFFENTDGLCTIVLDRKECFKVDHSYEEVIVMIKKYSMFSVARC